MSTKGLCAIQLSQQNPNWCRLIDLQLLEVSDCKIRCQNLVLTLSIEYNKLNIELLSARQPVMFCEVNLEMLPKLYISLLSSNRSRKTKLLSNQTNIVLSFTMYPKEFHSDFKIFLDCRKREWSLIDWHVRICLKLITNIDKVISSAIWYENILRR